MSAFAFHFKAHGPELEMVPYSPMLIEAESHETAFLMAMQQMTEFVNEGVISNFVIVGILQFTDQPMSEDFSDAKDHV